MQWIICKTLNHTDYYQSMIIAKTHFSDNFGFFQKPYIYLLLVSIIVALSVVAINIIFPNLITVQTWLSRLSVSVFGAYLTIVIVDHQIKKREKAELNRQRDLVLHQLHSHLNGHLNNLCKWYIISSEESELEKSESFEELFQSDYIHTVKHLDFSKDCSAYLNQEDWYNASSYFMSEFKDDVNNILEKYGAFIDSDLLRILLQVSDNPLINPMSMGSVIVPGDQNILNGENYDKALQIHLEAIQELIEYYDDPDLPDLEPIEEKSAWDEVEAGSARIDQDLEQTEPNYGVKNMEEERYKLDKP